MAAHDEPRFGRTPYLLVLSSLALGACASANLSPFKSANDTDRTFIGAAQTWDLNKDNSVTCDEWKEYVTTLVRESDSNADGALDATEYGVMARTDRLFDVANLGFYDSNGDGRASLDEITGKPNRAFELLDKTKDCRIDRNESVQVYGSDGGKAGPAAAPDTTGRGPSGR